MAKRKTAAPSGIASAAPPVVAALQPRPDGTWLLTLTDGQVLKLGSEALEALQQAAGLRFAPETSLDPATWAALQQQAQAHALWEKALALLARREHSRRELALKLRQRFGNHPALDDCLDKLSHKNLQSDQRFAAILVQERLRGLRGPRWVAHELGQKGVAQALIRQALAQPSPQAWLDAAQARAQTLWRKAQHKPQALLALRQGLFRAGFAAEHIQAVLAHWSTAATSDDTDPLWEEELPVADNFEE